MNQIEKNVKVQLAMRNRHDYDTPEVNERCELCDGIFPLKDMDCSFIGIFCQRCAISLVDENRKH